MGRSAQARSTTPRKSSGTFTLRRFFVLLFLLAIATALGHHTTRNPSAGDLTYCAS
ncbi:hypothetical protein EDWATA_02003 [Edwardsiella tarda ATCC 23685]|uniref:Uncharacterized protein n=1 Tax=Edwardsiella tarda ATCC 23685 TaxID=500638 RepID=D4F5H5_EDWTA|nr:hypothetical protein EDWATA_02003 [Edwardsiella tarda ATCC 23685]